MPKNEPMPIRNQSQIYQTHKWLLSNQSPHVFCVRCMLVPYFKCEKWIKLSASTNISHILLIVNKPPHLTIQSILEHLPYQDRLHLWQIVLQVLWLCTPGQFNLFKGIFLPYEPTPHRWQTTNLVRGNLHKTWKSKLLHMGFLGKKSTH